MQNYMSFIVIIIISIKTYQVGLFENEEVFQESRKNIL